MQFFVSYMLLAPDKYDALRVFGHVKTTTRVLLQYNVRKMIVPNLQTLAHFSKKHTGYKCKPC